MQNALNNIKIMVTEKKFSGRFAIVANAYAQNAPSADWAAVKELMTSTQVVNIAAAIRSLSPQDADYEEKKSKMKKQLPCITVHACGFTDGKRSNATAIDNGLACIDIDHLTADEGRALLTALTPEVCNEHGIIYVARSISTYGIWMLAERGHGERVTATQIRLQHVLNQLVNGIGAKVDTAVKDMARLRYITPWDYTHFANEAALTVGNEQLQAYADSLPTQVAQGQRHTTYKDWGIQALAVAGDSVTPEQVVATLPDLGLPLNERKSLIKWEKQNIDAPKASEATQAVVATNLANGHKMPLDAEALPLPKQTPQIIKDLVAPLPKQWRQTAALALLPSLSTACGRISYGRKKHPLAFQVAVYGAMGSGKSQLTCAPAQLVQEILGARDNEFIELVEKFERQKERPLREGEVKIEEQDLQAPRVMGFNTSTIMLAKYLKYSPLTTVMLYSDELGEAIGNSKSSTFLDLKSILRKGYDGAEHAVCYKERDSFRGKIYPRLSYLACGTPNVVFKYFDDHATEDGTSRRCIFVEHTACDRFIEEYYLADDQVALLTAHLQRLSERCTTVYHIEVEEAYKRYVAELQARLGADEILKTVIYSAGQHMLRATYLAHCLNDMDNQKIGDAIVFGRWVSEYFLRSFVNHNYEYLFKQQARAVKHFAPLTESTMALTNEQMYLDLPMEFGAKDVYTWREQNAYPHDIKNLCVLTRWQRRGLIRRKGDKFVKIA